MVLLYNVIHEDIVLLYNVIHGDIVLLYNVIHEDIVLLYNVIHEDIILLYNVIHGDIALLYNVIFVDIVLLDNANFIQRCVLCCFYVTNYVISTLLILFNGFYCITGLVLNNIKMALFYIVFIFIECSINCLQFVN